MDCLVSFTLPAVQAEALWDLKCLFSLVIPSRPQCPHLTSAGKYLSSLDLEPVAAMWLSPAVWADPVERVACRWLAARVRLRWQCARAGWRSRQRCGESWQCAHGAGDELLGSSDGGRAEVLGGSSVSGVAGSLSLMGGSGVLSGSGSVRLASSNAVSHTASGDVVVSSGNSRRASLAWWTSAQDPPAAKDPAAAQ